MNPSSQRAFSSIFRSIVPDHQQALISLLLARTDQFNSNEHAKAARELLAQIKGNHERAYYEASSGSVWGMRVFATAAFEPAHPHITRCGKQWIITR
jgi:hypothetical protein